MHGPTAEFKDASRVGAILSLSPSAQLREANIFLAPAASRQDDHAKALLNEMRTLKERLGIFCGDTNHGYE